LTLLRGPTPVLALASAILLRLPDFLKQGNTRSVNFWAIDGIIHASSRPEFICTVPRGFRR
jgi:hypothetical protein